MRAQQNMRTLRSLTSIALLLSAVALTACANSIAITTATAAKGTGKQLIVNIAYNAVTTPTITDTNPILLKLEIKKNLPGTGTISRAGTLNVNMAPAAPPAGATSMHILTKVQVLGEWVKSALFPNPPALDDEVDAKYCSGLAYNLP
ncbi:MAG TPA: hypothetical protein VKT77_10970 [Chthonomonadaceae bacterium]|nr:hypothetical protein [Chthonomonadaceae bacterium]